jgi:hypothetical protein
MRKDGRTDRHGEANSPFRNFANALKTGGLIYIKLSKDIRVRISVVSVVNIIKSANQVQCT